MGGPGRRRRSLLAWSLTLALVAGCAPGESDEHNSSPSTATGGNDADSAPIEGKVVVAVGDLICNAAQRAAAAGRRSQCQEEAVADVASSLDPDAVLLAGDIQYERGRASEYAEGWAHSKWKSFRPITFAAVGNHEYSTPGAKPFFAALGGGAGPPGRGWFSATVGTWKLVVLNSNCTPAGGCGAGSPQERWLRAELASAPECVMALWHHPRYSSGYHGDDGSVEPLWAALADANAELVVSGHDHHYERFAPNRGVVQFVAGTGGRSLYPTLGGTDGSKVRNSSTYGVLELRLGEGEWSWAFRGVPGSTFRDAGRARCR